MSVKPEDVKVGQVVALKGNGGFLRIDNIQRYTSEAGDIYLVTGAPCGKDGEEIAYPWVPIDYPWFEIEAIVKQSAKEVTP